MTDWETRAKRWKRAAKTFRMQRDITTLMAMSDTTTLLATVAMDQLRSVRDRLITESMFHAHGVKMRLLDIASSIKLPGEGNR